MQIDKGEKPPPRRSDAAPRGRGRPRGPTEQGIATRQRVYEAATRLIASRGYEETTLRDIAQKADVSVGLLYRYFPSKRAVVLALYDELSAEYAARAIAMKSGPWRERFIFSLRISLEVLGRHRDTLAALTPVLVGGPNDGLFAPATGFSRRRVQAVFDDAVRGAADAPKPDDAAALGRLLYTIHLAVLLWWLLDRSPAQKATKEMIAMLDRVLPLAAFTLRLEPARAFVRAADALCREAFFGTGDEGTELAAKGQP